MRALQQNWIPRMNHCSSLSAKPAFAPMMAIVDDCCLLSIRLLDFGFQLYDWCVVQCRVCVGELSSTEIQRFRNGSGKVWSQKV